MNEPVLQVEHLTKRFPGVLALDDVSLELHRNEVVGLIGENGAGKSTLLSILSGIYPPDTGTIRRDGTPVKFRSPRDAARAGIGIVHQEQALVDSVTVAENILLGTEGAAVRGGIYRWRDLNERARRQLARISSPISPSTHLSKLTFAQKQMVELAKAVAVQENYPDAPVIVFDEPTSVLEGADLEQLFSTIEQLRTVGSVIFVSHRLDEVLRVSDRVYVMRDGRCVAERDRSQVDTDELYRLMVGKESSQEFYQESEQVTVDPAAAPVLVTTKLGKSGSFSGVDLEVRPGEVVGLAGVQGAGREELSRVLFGAEPFDTGELRVGGRKVRFRSPVGAVRAGVGYVPAERKAEGIAQGLSVRENMILVDPRPVSFGPFINWRKAAAMTKKWISDLRIKTPSAQTDVATLSGGNQQKVVLAKWLSSPRISVLILDHPTRGLDVGAKGDVYGVIRSLCRNGMAIVLIGDTLEEVISMSHRVLVMRDGAVSATFDASPGNKPTPLELVEWMV